jgi:ABC-type iron transport system FetAB permease component
VVFWLFKDMCWMMEFKTAGALLILPTLAMGFYVLYLSKHKLDSTIVNLATIFWICANSAWMLNDFYSNLPKSVSLLFFIAGILTMFFYVWIAFIKPKFTTQTHDKR